MDESGGFAENNPAEGELAFGHFLVPRRADGSLWELGRGAMGVTYRAFDTSLRIEVALKVIRTEHVADEDARRRFQREARAAAKVRHPNVASVLYLGEQNGEFFYAMEFVAGRSLEFLREEAGGTLPPAVALALAAQAAAALNAAHKREVVHRDLKPANLMVLEGEALDHEDARTVGAGGRLLKIIDFGLARSFSTGRQEDSLVTQTFAGFIGTPAYASPEQSAGEQTLDGRSDLYSLGVILWQMLTGKLPFTGRVVEVLGKQQFQPPPWNQLDGFPAPVVELLSGLLTKDPAARRPQSASELRNALDHCLHALSLPETASPTRPAATVVDEPTGHPVPTTTVTLAPSTSLLTRYRLGREIIQGDGGRLFLAADNLQSGSPVAIKFLSPERMSGEANFLERTESALEIVRAHRHPALLALLSPGLEKSAESVFYVREWAEGFSLDELLRERNGELHAAEVFRLLDGLPAALDFTGARAFPMLELALHKLFVVPVAAVPAGDWLGLRAQPVTDWPAFALKLNPVGFFPPANTDTAEMTRVAGRRGGEGISDAARPTAALARLTRELLGAPADGLGPIGGLNGEANAVLRRALNPPSLRSGSTTAGAFADAGSFWRALRQASGQPVVDEVHAATLADVPAQDVPTVVALPSAPSPRPVKAESASVPPPESRPAPPSRKSPVGLITGILATLAVLSVGVIWFGSGHKKPAEPRLADQPAQPAETASPVPTPTLTPTPTSLLFPDLVPLLEPTPVDTPPPVSAISAGQTEELKKLGIPARVTQRSERVVGQTNPPGYDELAAQSILTSFWSLYGKNKEKAPNIGEAFQTAFNDFVVEKATADPSGFAAYLTSKPGKYQTINKAIRGFDDLFGRIEHLGLTEKEIAKSEGSIASDLQLSGISPEDLVKTINSMRKQLSSKRTR